MPAASSSAQPAMYMGEGGTIPFMGMLGEKFPGAQFMITGVLGPHSNAHGPNEFLHIPTGKRVTACVARVIAEHHLASQRGETTRRGRGGRWRAARRPRLLLTLIQHAARTEHPLRRALSLSPPRRRHESTAGRRARAALQRDPRPAAARMRPRHATKPGGDAICSTGILVYIIGGAVIGILARFFKPGADPMGWILTILLGIAGALRRQHVAAMLGVTGMVIGSRSSRSSARDPAALRLRSSSAARPPSAA